MTAWRCIADALATPVVATAQPACAQALSQVRVEVLDLLAYDAANIAGR